METAKNDEGRTMHTTWHNSTLPAGLQQDKKMQCTFWASNKYTVNARWLFCMVKCIYQCTSVEAKETEMPSTFWIVCIDTWLLTWAWLMPNSYNLTFLNNLSSQRVSLLNCDPGWCWRQFHSRWNHQLFHWTHNKEALKEKMIFAFLTETDFLNPRWRTDKELHGKEILLHKTLFVLQQLNSFCRVLKGWCLERET